MKQLKVVLVIPTYNERDNVVRLVPALQEQFGRMRHECHVLVVDDSSPDRTADAVRELRSAWPNVHLLSGRKAGLGDAYIRGIRHAIGPMAADVVYEMDADFSHLPADVPRLMQAIEEGADFVIGSRYVPGGSIPEEWAWYRKMNSRVGNLVARYVAGIHRVRDCTAGFRAIRAEVLRKIDLSHLHVQGYAFQVALLHAAVTAGARVREVPVDFVERTRGQSKLGLRDIVEFVVNAWWIRFSNSKTFLRFAAVGLSGVVVNLGAFTLLEAAGVNKFLASPIAIEISIVSNFLLNNYWTFGSRGDTGRLRVKGLKFNLVSFAGLAVSYGTFVLLSLVFPDGRPQLHQLIGIAPAMLLNYALNSHWTFRPVHRTQPGRD